MQVGTAHSSQNPNESYLDSKGTWLTYVILIAIGHLVILSVPFLDTATAWTITNTMHNVVSFLLVLVILTGKGKVTFSMKYFAFF